MNHNSILCCRSRELESIFNEFDTNKDGYISIDEARRALSNLGFSSGEIECLVVTYDTNGDGRLQYEEFVQLWNAQ
jgi:Ca2+-binding EF-hand superfamily protein